MGWHLFLPFAALCRPPTKPQPTKLAAPPRGRVAETRIWPKSGQSRLLVSHRHPNHKGFRFGGLGLVGSHPTHNRWQKQTPAHQTCSPTTALQLERFRTTWPTGPTTTSMSIHEHPLLQNRYLVHKENPGGEPGLSSTRYNRYNLFV